MKSIFLGNEYDINRVYAQDLKKRLSVSANLQNQIYTRDDVLHGKVDTLDVDYIFSTWGMPAFSEAEIKNYFKNLKAVFYAAGTVQGFAQPFLKCGIRIFSAWAANGVPVAEYTVAQIVLANKGYYKASELASNGNYFEAQNLFSNYKGNYDAKIGIIGAGMIGKMVIERLKAFKYEIYVFDPFLPDEKAKEMGVIKTSLEVIFEECNVVSNHLANNEQTQNIINGELLEKLPMYATFINTGRGAQVVEKDLIDILTKRQDLTAILDVTNPEPPIENSEMYKLKNCILTPHIAGSCGLEVHRMAEYMESEFLLFKNGKSTNYEVTLEMLKTMA